MKIVIVIQFVAIILLGSYSAWLRDVDKHNSVFVAEENAEIKRLYSVQSHLTEYFAKEGYELEFHAKGYTITKRFK